LKKGYDNLISNEIGTLTNEKMKEVVHVVAKLAIINYIYGPQDRKEKKLEFINRRIKRKLDKKIIPLIFIEIINLIFNKGYKDNKAEDRGEKDNDERIEDEEEYAHIDFNDMKTFIFEEFSKKLENNNDIENIIKLIDVLEGKNEKGKVDNQINKEKDNNKERI